MHHWHLLRYKMVFVLGVIRYDQSVIVVFITLQTRVCHPKWQGHDHVFTKSFGTNSFPSNRLVLFQEESMKHSLLAKGKLKSSSHQWWLSWAVRLFSLCSTLDCKGGPFGWNNKACYCMCTGFHIAATCITYMNIVATDESQMIACRCDLLELGFDAVTELVWLERERES